MSSPCHLISPLWRTRLDSRNATAYANTGIARLFFARDAEAENDFKMAFELDPGLKQTVEPLIKEAKTKRGK